MESFKKGEDIRKFIDLIDSNDQVIPLTSLSDYKIRMYSIDDAKELAIEFAKTASGDQKAIDVVNSANGSISITADRVWSKDAEPSTYFADVYLYFADDNGVDGKTLEIIEGVPLFNLEI